MLAVDQAAADGHGQAAPRDQDGEGDREVDEPLQGGGAAGPDRDRLAVGTRPGRRLGSRARRDAGGAWVARKVRTRSRVAASCTLTSTACSGKPVRLPVKAGLAALTNALVLLCGLSL
jgi:hypothetical protein